MAACIEEVSSSLVREYLSRKGLKRTIACMDEEHPRTEASINNRSHLRQILNLEDLYRKNKEHNCPLKSLLEIIVKYHITNVKVDKINCNKSDFLQSAPIRLFDSPAVTSAVVNDTKVKGLRSDPEEVCCSKPVSISSLPESKSPSSHSFWAAEAENQMDPLVSASLMDKQTPAFESTQKSRANRARRGLMAGPVTKTSLSTNSKGQNQRLPKKDEDYRQNNAEPLMAGVHHKSSITQGNSGESTRGCQDLRKASERQQRGNSYKTEGLDSPKTQKVRSGPEVSELNVSEMVLDDISDDDLQEVSRASLQRTAADHSFDGRPMDQHMATELKAVLLGSCVKCFPLEWRSQAFTFSEMHDLRYGIVQKKGGPCGVLASVQAFVLKMLLFECPHGIDTGLQKLRPSNTTRTKCLVKAVAEILWRAGEERRATVVINSGRNHFTPVGHYKSEGVLEKMTCFIFDNFNNLLLFVEQHIEQFELGPLGCILLTISAVLSRSIEKVREDMDVPTATLIGAHGYCTQELVNLLVCGRAVPNVFDDDIELDSGKGNVTLLKGIKSNCDVGLLSLFEHYNICKVGAYLKTPRYPIWLVCSESHFSVLFGLQRELLTSQDQSLQFDLYYYDGLANQQEEIRLTVSVGKWSPSFKDVGADLVPPLDLCIRTRWNDAYVNWNDTEPIL
ncbi:probable ubiquitin carboxyl-terminal hydrolase MINDY-4 [Takifugu flavidus]|uniref:Ubiquitin carboxyl-terminal hydrolase MINDY n=1 Tax=Takifugu flavidus TaxID=433684 RepID=A0A5C6MSN3_9TELE|nr:probable ubiquitin carboxyl-terminal hydrolase MINDY-4 [Takifugu flavidus]TWW57963.1 putative ubiquitin carboxyl-terminal hydrolase MINDY-4 [Takifugu flavidus]